MEARRRESIPSTQMTNLAARVKAFSIHLDESDVSSAAPREAPTFPPPSAETLESMNLQQQGLLVAALDAEPGVWRVSRASTWPPSLTVGDRRSSSAPDERDRRIDYLQRQCAALEAARGEREASMAVLAHELRGPTSAILGWTRLLRHPRIGLTQRERALAVIEQNALLQLALVDDLIDASRVAAHRLEIERASLSLGEIVGCAMETVLPKAVERQIALTCELADGCRVVGDGRRLTQVIANLLNNALKFTPVGGAVVVRLTADDGVATLRVEDTGVGIAAAQLPRVFEQFHQVSHARDAAGGLGLGLFLVREIVELHGGKVTAASPGEGLGSTFTVTLPLEAP